MKRRNPARSVKQILVRDFNWRMGNLRRWEAGIGGNTFDPFIKVLIARGIHTQMAREIERHQLRLWGESMNLHSFDAIHENARWRLRHE